MTRTTGRTFRLILKGLLGASEGKQVFLTTVNRLEADRVLKAASAMLRTYITSADITVRKPDRKIEFPNGGFLRVRTNERSLEEELRGLRYRSILELWDNHG